MADNAKFYVMRGDKVLYESMTKEEIYAAIVQAIEQGEIGDIDTGFVTKVKEQNRNNDLKFWRGTNAEYIALPSLDPDTFYIVDDAPGHTHTLFDNDLTVTGNMNINEKLTVADKVTMNDALEIQKDITARDINLRNINADAIYMYEDMQGLAHNVRMNGASISLDGQVDQSGSRNLDISNERVYYSPANSYTNYLAAYFDDMFWQELTLENGITPYSYGGVPTYTVGGVEYNYNPMFRKIGDRVDIAGSVKVTWDGSNNVNIGTLPVGFRPVRTVVYTVATAGKNIARLAINNAGVIRLEWFLAISDGHNITSEQWVELNTSFFIFDSNYIEHT